MSEHTKGLLALFRDGQSVGSSDGTGICEVWPRDENGFPDSEGKANARRIVACWNLLHEFDTAAIEAGTFADFIGQQVYLHEIENANSGELRLSDVSMQLMAAGFAGKMEANAAENYMEFGLFHPETGHITLTVQRAEGLTPAQKLSAMTKHRDALLSVLDWTDEQIMEFISTAFRHAQIKGDFELSDVRDALNMIKARAMSNLEGEQS
ncbi:hypothetical protein RRM56_000711 [Aeromonas salmonicida subsp. salmonicida]|uniref:Uncharacterized protein n=1 Tax=Aeromonas salmonicida subsp. salmonicida TaxID=29491 RepID=A0A0B0F5X1_AERSS|nr:hypothetical protein [Aeromonas salmonicida]AIZ49688.1 hypothetical protein [Aeromonas salmonicida subsp. salmonicida]ELI6443102.1 hypothetical protein [Aeromonas salmonicida subsp. salmonicida]KHE97367.1 hypothetical protein NX85_17575 [Aeromonas salmonicida subsp. salmonicida]KHE98648.1 hypothetical protein NV17_08170 [Aeromonas salmonicida subsp. salmonicida]OKA85912.1 hypothetical protein BHR43_17640 [Aeromonas salmonicida subsp. salmonicida]